MLCICRYSKWAALCEQLDFEILADGTSINTIDHSGASLVAAEEDRNRNRDDGRIGGQEQGIGKSGTDGFRNRGFGDQRIPEITGYRVAQPFEITHRSGPIQAKLREAWERRAQKTE